MEPITQQVTRPLETSKTLIQRLQEAVGEAACMPKAALLLICLSFMGETACQEGTAEHTWFVGSLVEATGLSIHGISGVDHSSADIEEVAVD